MKRTLTFAAIGLLFVGPCMFVWYGWLGKMVPGSDFASVMMALALDQVQGGPASYCVGGEGVKGGTCPFI